MALPINIEVLGVEKVRALVQIANKKALDSMSRGLSRASIFVQGEVKNSIFGNTGEPKSVDTGVFVNSVSIKKKNKDTAVIFSPVSYAEYLEFKIGGRGRRHFENSKNRSKGKVKEIFQKALNDEFKNI